MLLGWKSRLLGRCRGGGWGQWEGAEVGDGGSSRRTQAQMLLPASFKTHQTVRLSSSLANAHIGLWAVTWAADLLFWLLRRLE